MAWSQVGSHFEAHCKVPAVPNITLLEKKRERFFHLPKISSRKLASELLDIDSMGRCGVENLERELLLLRNNLESHGIFDVRRLEALNDVFDQINDRFTTLRPLLAEIKREYSGFISGILNVQKEKNFLRAKIQRLICDIGTTDMLQKELSKVESLSSRLQEVEKKNKRLKSVIADEEKRFLGFLVDLFIKELNKTTGEQLTNLADLNSVDEKIKMSLRFRGRKTFVKEWLVNEAKKEQTFEELQTKIESDEDLGQYLEKVGTEESGNDNLGTGDSVERKKDVEQLQKFVKTSQKEINTLNEKIDAYNSELMSWNQKIEEIEHFLPAGVKASLQEQFQENE
ncbi:hypothetical protein HDU67_004225 [Dinochytrium kinnereticum]|nr:hypothetical protein HDU67_004225 [Dinochytrium kinnereticum]